MKMAQKISVIKQTHKGKEDNRFQWIRGKSGCISESFLKQAGNLLG